MSENIVWPQPPEKLLAADGKSMSNRFWQPLSQIAKLINALNKSFGSQIGDITLGTAASLDLSLTQPTCASFVFKAPDAETVRVIINSPSGWTITGVTTRSNAGTATVAVSINGVALGGGSNAATTSELTVSHSTANVVPAGGDVEITFSSVSSCENLTVTIFGTYELQS